MTDTLSKFPNSSASFRRLNGDVGGAESANVNPEPRTDFKVSKTTDEAKLNKTESAYYAHLRRLNPPYLGVQNITLKLADDTRLTPDFSYIDQNGCMVFVDVKGFQREDALIKMKVAARLFRWAKFVIVKKDGFGWDETEVRP